MTKTALYHITTATMNGVDARDWNDDILVPGLQLDTFELYLIQGQEREELESQLDWNGEQSVNRKTLVAFYVADDGKTFGIVQPPTEETANVDSTKKCTCQPVSQDRGVLVLQVGDNLVSVEVCNECGGFFWETEEVIAPEN